MMAGIGFRTSVGGGKGDVSGHEPPAMIPQRMSDISIFVTAFFVFGGDEGRKGAHVLELLAINNDSILICSRCHSLSKHTQQLSQFLCIYLSKTLR